jgi:dynein heavy chain
MGPRHFEQLEKLVGCSFDLDNPTLDLGSIMQAPLIENKEDIEDICIASVKEEDIQQKLASVVKEWTAHEITFSNFIPGGSFW